MRSELRQSEWEPQSKNRLIDAKARQEREVFAGFSGRNCALPAVK
jgi:hypothetical protein